MTPDTVILDYSRSAATITEVVRISTAYGVAHPNVKVFVDGDRQAVVARYRA